MTNSDIKYKAIFGDMAKFNGMMPDCVFVLGEYGYKIVEDTLYYCERYNERYGWSKSCLALEDFKPVAMRHIIETPVWTVADQKAGRLPEVGAELIHKTKGICYFVGVGLVENACWALKLQSGLIYIAEKSWCSPIETPREKYDRERDEWVNSLRNKLPPLNMSFINGMIKAYEELKPFTGDDHD